MEKNHNESVLISVKKITNVELKKSAFISVNQRLKKIQIPKHKFQIPKPETSNHKPQTFQLKINHNESVLISVKKS